MFYAIVRRIIQSDEPIVRLMQDIPMNIINTKQEINTKAKPYIPFKFELIQL